MPDALTCYYLDEPLDAHELTEVSPALLGYFAKFRTGAARLEHRRVPFLVPAPDSEGRYAGTREERARKLIANLRHAGIRSDAGRRVAWIMPADSEWDALFQFAIRLETGLAPYAIQRWHQLDRKLQRGPLRVYDTEMLIKGLE